MPQGEGDFPQRDRCPKEKGAFPGNKRNNFLKGKGGRGLNCLRSNFPWGASSQMFDKKIQGKTLSKSNNLYIIEKILKHKIINI
jgi:hypothetical protein